MSGARSRPAALSIVCFVALALACVSPAAPPEPSTVHVVRRGENLFRIALHYGVSVDALIRENGIRD
ncbi:MAG TPA: LysM domain-containing protein, partial [Myxococcota bacterium]|nr:LysM domain-containing protein [Myxococcota bacterium]